MRKIVGLIVVTLMLCTIVFASTPSNWAVEYTGTVWETEQPILTIIQLYNKYNEANVEYNMFEDKLNAQMPKDENYMFSPLSIKMALAMAANGADGVTLEEMLQVTGIESLEEFNEKSRKMMEEYSKSDLLKVNIANSVWINKDLTSQRFSSAYRNTVKEFYDAESKVSNNVRFVDEVNSWVAEKTNDKIIELIDNPSHWAMLINAIYFKGGWALEFDEALTAPDTFTNADGTEVMTDFMNQTDYFLYYENEGTKILEMPYKNRFYTMNKNGETVRESSDLDISMYAVMSNEDIPAVNVLNKAVNEGKFGYEYVKLSMPKFEINYSNNLGKMFYDMGMKTAFEESADFKKMFTAGNMQIMDILHVTYIKVDEKFTEAAAVTGIGMGAGCAIPPEPIEFKLNKPFTFVIRDNTNGEILFMGRYAFAE